MDTRKGNVRLSYQELLIEGGAGTPSSCSSQINGLRKAYKLIHHYTRTFLHFIGSKSYEHVTPLGHNSSTSHRLCKNGRCSNWTHTTWFQFICPPLGSFNTSLCSSTGTWKLSFTIIYSEMIISDNKIVPWDNHPPLQWVTQVLSLWSKRDKM